MNLYRSFGCLLEAWITEGYPDTVSSFTDDSEKNLDPNSSSSASSTSLRLMGVTLRSGSEDSGVELSHTVTPLASPCQVLNLELPTGIEDLRPSSSSPPLSSRSASSSCISTALKGSLKMTESTGLTVEEALQRTETSWRRNTDSRLRRRCNTTSAGMALQASIVRYRAENIRPERPPIQPLGDLQKPRNLQHTQDLNNLKTAEKENERLSPGLLYLEQMCRMLETIAVLQQQNQNLQLHINKMQSQQQELQTKVHSTQTHKISSAVTEKLEVNDTGDQTRLSFNEFRRRTVSDTWTFLRHRSKSKVPQGEQLKSTGALLEEPDEPQAAVAEQPKASNSLKQRIKSLGKNEKIKPPTSSSPNGERKMTIRQLFRGRRKTTRF